MIFYKKETEKIELVARPAGNWLPSQTAVVAVRSTAETKGAAIKKGFCIHY